MDGFSMALVDVLDWMPNDHPQTPELVAMLNRLAAAISGCRIRNRFVVSDPGPGRPTGQLPRSSASCMLPIPCAKACKKAPATDYLVVAQRAYEGILARFIRTDSLNTISITEACSVAGLGGDPYRDGSFAYYVGEPRRDNDPKAVGPFILASLQFESLTQ
jgi:unsaturated rhamnogalacturonyl hydrolase